MRTHRPCTLLVSSGFILAAYAQELTGLQVLSPPCQPLTAQVTVFFPFGFQLNCPDLSGFTVEAGGDTAHIDLYYDVSGVWLMVGCWNTALIDTALPPGTGMIELRTFSILDGDTLAVVSDTLFSTCATGIPGSMGGGPAWWWNDDRLCWDPTTSSPVEIINSEGRIIRTGAAHRGTCWTGDLPSGVYIARWPAAGKAAVIRFVRP